MDDTATQLKRIADYLWATPQGRAQIRRALEAERLKLEEGKKSEPEKEKLNRILEAKNSMIVMLNLAKHHWSCQNKLEEIMRSIMEFGEVDTHCGLYRMTSSCENENYCRNFTRSVNKFCENFASSYVGQRHSDDGIYITYGFTEDAREEVKELYEQLIAEANNA